MLKHAESRCRRLGAALLFVVGLTGCDFEVTNPGPVEDSFLTSPGTFQAVVNGIKRTVYAVDNDTTSHFATIEDAQRFIRRRS